MQTKNVVEFISIRLNIPDVHMKTKSSLASRSTSCMVGPKIICNACFKPALHVRCADENTHTFFNL